MELRHAQDPARGNPIESDVFGCCLSLMLARKRPLKFDKVVHWVVPFHDTRCGSSEAISLDNHHVTQPLHEQYLPQRNAQHGVEPAPSW